ncbi:MAG: sn-glycerol-3-phosphate ABC transporter ATP-binding protein UgpC [Proteobacteria bacterium]|nr:sn-glycerol-3-phosphate ABC transporter ATP-binding protein UgpC [Pseudomonadota bacterium]
MAKVVIESLSKNFDRVEAVKNFELEIDDREFVVLVGPSGCGKSTTLRCVAGLEEVTAGEIYIGDQMVNDLPPRDRNIAMVFQDYALYPHMSVYQNMAFGLKLRKYAKAEINQRVREAAQILGIEELLQRKPRELSGGQRQRVAVGRAIVRKPSVFLFDEPLSNLDAKLRVQMRAELSKLHQQLQTTIVYVTHDQVEAMTMGTKIVIMKDGEIQQVGTPMEVYEYPVNLFVAGFIGSPAMNFIPGKIISKDSKLYVDAESFELLIPSDKEQYLEGKTNEEVIFGIRPENMQDKSFAEKSIQGSSIKAVVEVVEPLGSEVQLFVTSGEHSLVARVDPRTRARLSEEIELILNTDKIHIFEKDPPHFRIRTEERP